MQTQQATFTTDNFAAIRTWYWLCINKRYHTCKLIVSDIAIFVLKRDVKLQLTNTQIDRSYYLKWVKVLHPIRLKIGHFRDILPSQSLGFVQKKLNQTQQKQTTQEQNGKNIQKTNLNLNQWSTLRTVHVCMQIIVHNCRTQYHTEQFW